MVSGQQDPVLSNYMFNTQTYNPAYSGMTGMITATALTRQQRAPRRRSRLAGCTWSWSKGDEALMAPPAIRASMDWQGKMPWESLSVIVGLALRPSAASASGGCARGAPQS